MSENWEEVSEIFSEAIKLPVEQRADFLDQRCGSDAELRARVEQLLAEDERAIHERFLETQPWRLGFDSGEPLPDLHGREIGAYTIEAAIARGGMGDVYRARRTDGIEQTVAIKLLRVRGSDSDLTRRFRNEVNFQARVSQHANIAGLIDAGNTDDGVSFLVMQYVPGEPITKFCDEAAFDVRQRVELFQTVCSAVSFAHQQLVIHRDIKPSNILVTADGKPFLLDFGIASEDSAEPTTRTQYRALTPEYASPEQIRDQTLSTATDVYSLGVVLYELLTGSRPHDLTGLDRMQCDRMICEVDPPQPSNRVKSHGKRGDAPDDKRTSTTSKLRRALAGDLDAIVMKALERHPPDRYQSVAEMVADIQRYLAGEAVKATRQTVFYVARKFVRRNRVVVASTLLVAVVLVAGVVGTSIGMVTASQQRDVADSERRRANDWREQLQSVFDVIMSEIRTVQSESKDVPEARDIAERLATKSTEGLEQLRQAFSGDTRPDIGLVDVNLALGDFANIAGSGGPEKKREYYEDAYRLAKLLPTEGESRFATYRAVARSALRLGTRRQDDGELDAAIDLYSEARDKLQVLVSTNRADQGDENSLASASSYLADIYVTQRRFTEAAANYRIAHEQYVSIERQNPDDERARRAVVTSLYLQGRCAEKSGDNAKAIDWFQKSRDQTRAIIDELGDATSPSTLRILVASLNKLGSLTVAVDPDAARPAYEEGIGIVKKLLDRDPHNFDYQDDLAVAHMKFGDMLAISLDYAAARQQYLKALELRTRLLDSDDLDASNRLNYFRSIYAVARMCKQMGDFGTAVTSCKTAIDRLRPAAESPTASIELIASVAQLELECAYSLRRHGDYLQAAEVLDIALERLRQSDEIHQRNVYASTIEQYSVWAEYNRKRATLDSDLSAIRLLASKHQAVVLTEIGRERAKEGAFNAAIELAAALGDVAANNTDSLYKAACIYALCARSDSPDSAIERALELLERQLGVELLAKPPFPDLLLNDSDLDALRELPQFKELMKRVERQSGDKP